MKHEDLLAQAIESAVVQGASDIHFSHGSKPMFRVNRELSPFRQLEKLTKEDTEKLINILVTDDDIESLQRSRHLLFSYEQELTSGNMARLRGTAFYQKGGVSIALRVIQEEIPKIEDLNLPTSLRSICKKQQGLFLVVGPAGQGKTTTLVSMVDTINSEEHRHIIMLENPVEYHVEEKESIISQREIPHDVRSFQTGVETALRSDADVIVIGEVRKAETFAVAMTAAEVGHLVFATVHTNDASQTIHRIIDSFPTDQQNQIRYQLSQSLLGVFSIRLLPRIGGGLIPAYELLLNNSAVANLIRENRVASIESVLQTSVREGMVSFNRSLARLVQDGLITLETAYEYSNDANILRTLL